jgi:hypothetical protein
MFPAESSLESTQQPASTQQPDSGSCYSLSSTLGTVLVVIGALAIAGIMPGSTAGWIGVGMGAALIVFNLIPSVINILLGRGSCIDLVLKLVLPIIFTTLGALAATGSLSAYQFGWGIIGPGIGLFGIVFFLSYCAGCLLPAG